MPEVEICSEVEIHGGEFEWVCVLPPHGERRMALKHNIPAHMIDSHYFKAFKKIA